MGWFADWRVNFTVSDINWTGYSAMAFFAAQPDDNLNVILTGNNAESMLVQFVSTAHAHNVKALLTIGGWDGSTYWSSSVATTQNRSTFANNIVQFAHRYNLDGIDLDWEYPGKPGMDCNIFSPNDAANYLEFITELYQLVVPNLSLSAAVPPYTYTDATNTPISGFAEQLDWIEIMAYDIFGSWSKVTGPNAPLNDACSPYRNGSAVSAVAAWTNVGFSADQIVLGVPSYGRGYFVPPSTAAPNGNQLEIYTPFNAIPQGDPWNNAPPDIAGACAQSEAPTGSGVFEFWALIGYGYLNSNGSVAPGMLSTFDQCSQTPFVYNSSTEILISYDDPQSFTAKGQYIAQAGLRGFSLYEVGGDHNGLLVNAISKAMS